MPLPALSTNHGMLYGNVALTFVVQMAFDFLLQNLFGKEDVNGAPDLT